MNLILEGPCRMSPFVDLRLVFEALGVRQREFNWLITDLEYAITGLQKPETPPWPCNGPRELPHWISGDDLASVVDAVEMQIHWAVFTGFSRDIELDLQTLNPLPYADGNPDLWHPETRMQHPLAQIEIVCWDNTSLLLLCSDSGIGESFRAFFPEAVDLNEYNRSRA
jgi:hypothetical protein